MSRITPNALWLAHRTATGGRSTISGAPLPETLDDCPVGPQETHYAMSCFAASLYGDVAVVPIPPKISHERAMSLREEAAKQAQNASVLSGLVDKLSPQN